MNERVKFMAACLAREDDDESFAELCERYGISAKTGYKWLRRYEEGGVTNLVERSRVGWHESRSPMRKRVSTAAHRGSSVCSAPH
jgi:transposase-like protein